MWIHQRGCRKNHEIKFCTSTDVEVVFKDSEKVRMPHVTG